jgi:hypothetical protein
MNPKRIIKKVGPSPTFFYFITNLCYLDIDLLRLLRFGFGQVYL